MTSANDNGGGAVLCGIRDGQVIASFAGTDLRARLNLAEDPGSPAVLSLHSTPGSRFQLALLLPTADLIGLRDMLTRALEADAARRAPDPALARDLDAWTRGEPTGDDTAEGGAP